MSRELFEEWYRVKLSQSTSQVLIDSILAREDSGRYAHEGVEQTFKAWEAAYQKGLDEGWNAGYTRGVREPRMEVVRFVPTATLAVSLLEDVLRDHAEWSDEDTRENIILSFSEKLRASTEP